MKEMIIGFGGVVLGFILSLGGTIFYDFWKARAARRSLASALYVEIFSQADWCSRNGTQWNVAQHSSSVEIKMARKGRPPPAKVFDAVAGKVDMLDAATAAKVIAFHGAVDAVRARIDAWNSERDAHALRGESVKDLAAKWRAACFQGLITIRALDPQAKIPPQPNDKAMLLALKENLETVANGGVITQGGSESAEE